MPQTIHATARDLAIAAARSVPPLPHGAAEVLKMLSSWDVDFAKVAAIIEKDPVLTSRVLQIANSAIFNRGASIGRVQHAVTLLGIMPLRAYAVGWTMISAFRRLRTPKFWDHKAFLAHSAAVASLSSQLANTLDREQSHEAYISGLIHDIGKLILAVNLPEEYSKVTNACRLADRPLRDLELDLIGIDHAELSGIAAENWHFPESICTAVRYHHTPWLDLCCDLPLSLLISKADSFINSLDPALLTADQAPEAPFEWPGYQTQATEAVRAFQGTWLVTRSLIA